MASWGWSASYNYTFWHVLLRASSWKLHAGDPHVQFERRTEASICLSGCASSDPTPRCRSVDISICAIDSAGNTIDFRTVPLDVCPHCGTLNTFTHLTTVLACVCDHCGEGVKVADT